MLNVVLLIICISIVIAVIAYLFYLNRFIGFLLGLVCRLAFWNSGETSIWVSIGTFAFCSTYLSTHASLRHNEWDKRVYEFEFEFVCGFLGSISFSILTGRISFKDLRYHSSNQTILAVKGQISWRYWIRAPAEEDDLIHARVIGEDIHRKSFNYVYTSAS